MTKPEQTEFPVGEPLLTVAEVAERLEVTDKTVRIWLSQGRLSGRQIGRQWYFVAAEVDRFEKARRR